MAVVAGDGTISWLSADAWQDRPNVSAVHVLAFTASAYQARGRLSTCMLSLHPEELEHVAIAVLLGIEPARVIQAVLGSQHVLLARAAARHEDAGRLVIVVACRR